MLQDRFSVNSQRKIKKLNSEIATSIINKIKSMQKNPIPYDAMRCKDREFRESIFEIIYMGYKILYELNFEDNIILVHNVEKAKL